MAAGMPQVAFFSGFSCFFPSVVPEGLKLALFQTQPRGLNPPPHILLKQQSTNAATFSSIKHNVGGLHCVVKF